MKFSRQFPGLFLCGIQVTTPPTPCSHHLASSIPHAPGWLWTLLAASSHSPCSSPTVPPDTGNFRTQSLNLFCFLIYILHELLLELSIYNIYSPTFSPPISRRMYLTAHLTTPFGCQTDTSFLAIPQTLKISVCIFPKLRTLFYITSIQLSK